MGVRKEDYESEGREPNATTYSIKIAAYRRQVLGVRAKVGRTVLSVVAPSQDVASVVQLIGYGCTVNLHAGGKHDQIVPLWNLGKQRGKSIWNERDKQINALRAHTTYNVQEVIDVGPLVHEEAHRMPIDRHLDREVVRRPRLDRVARHRVMVGVYERLVQVQHQRLPLDHAQPVAGDRRQREQLIPHRLMLYKLRQFNYRWRENHKAYHFAGGWRWWVGDGG